MGLPFVVATHQAGYRFAVVARLLAAVQQVRDDTPAVSTDRYPVWPLGAHALSGQGVAPPRGSHGVSRCRRLLATLGGTPRYPLRELRQLLPHARFRSLAPPAIH